MKKYTIVCEVTAQGTQTFTVEAKSEEDALVQFKIHGGEFVSEEIEVMGLGDPQIV